MAQYENGAAMNKAIITRIINCRDNKTKRETTLAPSTFRMPISRVRCSTVNIVRPNKPRQQMNMPRNANQLDSLLTICSLLYNLLKLSLAKEYTKGNLGLIDFHNFSRLVNACF